MILQALFMPYPDFYAATGLHIAYLAAHRYIRTVPARNRPVIGHSPKVAMTTEKAPLSTALWRGLRRQCPACGEASAFRGYLKIADTCPNCHTPLGLYPCDDGPAYITMLLVGHLVVGPLFALEFFWKYPLGVVIAVTLGALVVMTLALLPFIKGGFLALLWHHGLKRSRQPH